VYFFRKDANDLQTHESNPVFVSPFIDQIKSALEIVGFLRCFMALPYHNDSPDLFEIHHEAPEEPAEVDMTDITSARKWLKAFVIERYGPEFSFSKLHAKIVNMNEITRSLFQIGQQVH
jgi:hypothetical protein